jgi:hypothetical protein
MLRWDIKMLTSKGKGILDTIVALSAAMKNKAGILFIGTGRYG